MYRLLFAKKRQEGRAKAKRSENEKKKDETTEKLPGFLDT